MQPIEPILVTDAIRDRVATMVQRLAASTVEVAPGWEAFGNECQVSAATGVGVRSLAIGPPEFVLAAAAALDRNDPDREFGFICPVAERVKPWQRASGWRRELTIELWGLGWSTVDVDRLLAPAADAVYEFAIGNARPTIEPTTDYP